MFYIMLILVIIIIKFVLCHIIVKTTCRHFSAVFPSCLNGSKFSAKSHISSCKVLQPLYAWLFEYAMRSTNTH